MGWQILQRALLMKHQLNITKHSNVSKGSGSPEKTHKKWAFTGARQQLSITGTKKVQLLLAAIYRG